MRIAIFGAGSIGCFVGGAWAAAGCEVTLIGRSRIGQEVKRHGLRLSDFSGWSANLPPEEVRFATDPAALADADIIVLCVKSTDTAKAAEDIARHAKPDAAILSLQNGVGNVDRIRVALPGRAILAGMVPYNVAHIGGGRWHRGTAGALVAERHPATTWLAGTIGKDNPAALVLSDDMQALLWGKLLINLNNAVNALSGKPLLAQLGERGYRRVVAASQREALRVLKRAGIRPARVGALPPAALPLAFAAPDFLFRHLLLKAHKVDAKARTSMADDFAAGRPTEIDYLNGEVVRLARRIGREAPVNARIVGIVHAAERGGRRQWSARDLEQTALG